MSIPCIRLAPRRRLADSVSVRVVVNPSPTSNNSCFLPDADILGLYSFSFNISDTSSGYPPQCSNLSMSWASSLDSNVTGGILRRNLPEFTDELFPGSPVPPDLKQLDQSSSEHNGNTTKPPTMFGLIPLGNSFSIPITYSSSSRFAKQLPDSAVSSNPTTWTGMGVTHLNWTVDMAKGTRFILVAGIGSDEQWASGGSSAMLTVGQGSTGCIGSEQAGSGAPSVTASEDTYVHYTDFSNLTANGSTI